MPEPVAIGPGYVANDVEIHTSIVSKHAGPVNANKSPNDEGERREVALPRNEAALSKSSTPSLAHRRRDPRLNRLSEVGRLNIQTSPGRTPNSFTVSNTVMTFE
jgi:hypothetical protein